MKIPRSMRNKKEQGAVLTLFAAGLMVFVAFLAFVVDIARAYNEQRKVQMAADASSLAALSTLGSSVNYDSVLGRVTSVANANNITTTEVTAVAPRCGVWASGSFTPASSGTCTSTANAVEVTVRRTLPVYFSEFIFRDSFLLEGRAVSYMPPSTGNCIRPFGIEEAALSSLNLANGSTFTVEGTQSAGNWGKIDLDGNSSSGTVYTSLMLNNLCNDAFTPGNWVSVGTGNAQISQVFDTILSDATPPLAWQNMVFAVTTDFPKGNGLVQIRRFMRVDLLAERGNGQGWSATLRVREIDAQPDSAVPGRRTLVE